MAPSWKAALSFFSLAAAPAGGSSSFHGLVSSESWLPREPVVLTATGEELMQEKAESLPANWDWRNVNGQSYVTADVNQHIPQYCGACWVHGTVAQINDRIKIARAAAFPDVMISRQALMNCVEGEGGFTPGCFGGDSWMIYKHMITHRVPDESCAPYRAENAKCEPDNICRNCQPPPSFVAALKGGKNASEILAMHIDMTEKCYAIPQYVGYGVKEYGTVSGETAMMKEIYARGPISCNMDATDDFMYHYAENVKQHEGVFVAAEQSSDTDHVIEVAGWGTTPSGERYWIVRNSWGTYWGQSGWFKLRRGDNKLLIETNCTWSIPEFDETSLALEGKVLGDYISGVHFLPEALVTGMASQQPSNTVSWPVLLALVCSSLSLGAAFASALILYTPRRKLHQAPLLG